MSVSPSAELSTIQPAVRQAKAFVPMAAALIVFTTFLCYSNSFSGVFVFDDHTFIETNSYIRNLWPPGQSLFGGNNLSRPLVGYSLAINYWLSGLSPWSYHALNLLIHMGAALALFGLVRRTLQLPALAQSYGKISGQVALVIALIWAVHPLQTQSVTYVTQRCESLMGMWYLLTVYLSLRSFTASKCGLWIIAAALACIAGMLSKQVMVTAPVMVLAFDYLFFSGSVRSALRRQWQLYGALAFSWIALLGTMLAGAANDTAGFGIKSISPLQYLLSESSVLCHYVRLSWVPTPLVFDYGWPKVESFQAVLPYAIPVCLFAGLTAYLLWRRSPAAIFGVWFLLILTITSTIMPIDDLAVEHRMYLPLAAVISGSVFACIELWRRIVCRKLAPLNILIVRRNLAAILAASLLIVLYGTMTLARNQDYRSEIALWADTVVKRPENARARNNFGNQLRHQQRLPEAIAQFTEAIAINPAYAQALYNRGTAFKETGDLKQAERDLIESLELDPSSAEAHNNLGSVYASQGDFKSGEAHFLRAVELQPTFTSAQINLAAAYAAEERYQEAKVQAEAVLQISPGLPAAHFIMAVAAEALGDSAAAEQHLWQVVRLDGDNLGARLRLCRILRRRRRDEDAVAQYRELARLSPSTEEAWMELGELLEAQGLTKEAMETYHNALVRIPNLKVATAALARLAKLQKSAS